MRKHLTVGPSAEQAPLRRPRQGPPRYGACLRGRVFSPDGLLKLVFEKANGIIVGVHIIGSDACELVHYGMSLVNQKVPKERGWRREL